MNVLIKEGIKRGLKIFIFVSLSLFLIELLKQHSLKESAEIAFFWSSISTLTLVLSQMYHHKKGNSCALCESDSKPEGKI